MKIVTISKGKVELARGFLNRPFVTIGRAPSCDVVLRAPGVAPVHFVLEWMGQGAFDPKQALWTLIDVSNASQGASTGEGVVLSQTPEQIGEFYVALTEDSLQPQPEIGGVIHGSLSGAQGFRASASPQSDLLEIVQIRDDSGAVEEVLHLSPARRGKKLRPLKRVPEFQIQWLGDAGKSSDRKGLMEVLASEMPGAEIYAAGSDNPRATAISAHELLVVKWKGRKFYLRLVSRIPVPPAARRVMDPLMRKILLRVLAGAVLLGLWVVWASRAPRKEPVPEPRVARIEIIERAPPPPVAEPEPAPAQAQNQPTQTTAETAVKPAAATAPKVAKQSAKKTGINQNASQADVNAVGILGALKQAGNSGKGVSSEALVNAQSPVQPIAGKASAPVLVKQAPAAALGVAAGGTPAPKSPGLNRASSTLSSANKFDPSSSGAIAVQGAAPSAGLGVNTEAREKDSSAAGKALPEGGEGEDGAVVAGGLDRETVRRVVASYRGQIRGCYERSLITEPGLNGRISYNWIISGAGPVTTVNTGRSTVGSDKLEGCVLSVVKGMKFPRAPNGRPTQVVYPFVFQGLN